MAIPLSTTLSSNDEASPTVAVHNTPLRDSVLTVTPTTERRFWAASPSVPSQTPRGPQRQRQSVRFSVGRRRSLQLSNAGQARRARAQKKNRHAAKDVWTFFEEVESKTARSCLFCK